MLKIIIRNKFCLLNLICFFAASASASNEASVLLSKAEEYRHFSKSYTMFLKITDVSPEGQQLSEYRLSIKDRTSTLVEQVAPEKAKGRKMLMIKNDLWLFTPDIKKPIRIGLAQKLTGETANGDITKTDFLNDYKPELLEKNKEAIKLKLSSADQSTTYSKIIYYLSPADNRPIKAEFFAQSGKLLKTAYYGRFVKIKNKEVLTEIKIVDAIRNNKYSTLTYSRFESKNLHDSLFNKASF